MRLRNKKTGEIVELVGCTAKDLRTFLQFEDENGIFKFECKSLTEINEEWEDYKEPKEHWCITMYGGTTRIKDDEEPIDDLIEIGNYFNSKEDAYDAWDKLKAYKRLKDKGFRFTNWEFRDVLDGALVIEARLNFDNDSNIQRDLEICFGGEE